MHSKQMILIYFVDFYKTYLRIFLRVYKYQKKKNIIKLSSM